MWRQWKHTYTRAKNLIKLGLADDAAWRFVKIQRGPWATAETNIMHRVLRNCYFDSLGLFSLQEQSQRLQRVSRTAVYGTVRAVVWEDGGGNPASYPIDRGKIRGGII